MSLRGICPCCHAVVSLDAMVKEEDARAVLALVADMPGGVARAYVQYLGLFRNSTRAVSWSKLRRLTSELLPMIREEKVARDGRRLPAPHAIWIAATEELLARRGKPNFRLPLESHGYLLEMVYGKAEVLAEVESRANEAARRAQEEQLKRRQPTQAVGAERSTGGVPDAFKHLGARLGIAQEEG